MKIMLKYLFLFPIAMGWAFIPNASAQPQPETSPAPDELTVITSERLTYDGERHFIVFERNVVINDASMNMTADHVTVGLDQDNNIRSILAVGNVVMTEEIHRAWAQRATYNVVTGVVVLEGEPRVMRGRDLIAGERITFWRNEQRMLCEPHARLVIYPESDGIQPPLEKAP